MALEILSRQPTTGDFTPLEEHQTQTPGTFFGGKPVLHFHHASLTLEIPRDQLASHATIAKFTPDAVADGPAEGTPPARLSNVEIWATSERLILFQTSPTKTGISIPYPSIALHAISSNEGADTVYMELSLNDASLVNDEDEIEILEVTVLAPTSSSTNSTTIKDLYAAMNTCSDLNPDPDMSDEEEEEAQDTAPGAGGWITAETMDQYLDENGNFIGAGIGDADGIFAPGEALGPGAGTVRPRRGDDDDPYEDGDGTNGTNGASDDTKWRRTE